jgi:hypothetical protein
VPDLFLSYAREDEDRIAPLASALEARGWTVFWDRHIPAGSTWRTHIGEALRDARCVLVAWSRHSISSRWVIEEADDAQTRGVMVPILLDQVTPPIGFRSVQTADLTRWRPPYHAGELDRLCDDIESILGSGTGARKDAARHVEQPPPEAAGVTSRRPRRLWPVIVAASVTAVAGLAGWYLREGSPIAKDSRAAPASESPAVPAPPAAPAETAAPPPTRDEPKRQLLSASSRIAFISNREGEPAMYVMETDGSAQTRLSQPGGSDVALAWSPDGGRIAFVSNRGGSWRLHVMSADGGRSRALSEARAHVRPAWSPDGNKLAFTSDHEGNADIYVIAELRDSTRRRLTTEPSNESSPSWSPDGVHLAFTSNRDGTSEVYVMDADGTNQRRVTRPPTAAVDVVWSPDGKRLAYITRSGLFVMNVDGSNSRGLAPKLRALSVSWSPDGTQLAFHGSALGEGPEIFTVNVDGTNVRRLTKNVDIADYRPAWSPMLSRPRSQDLPRRPAVQ